MLTRKLIKSRPDILITETQKIPLCPAWLYFSNNAEDTAAGKQITQWHLIQRFPFSSPSLQKGTVPSEGKMSHLILADSVSSHLGFWVPYAVCFSWDSSQVSCLHSSRHFKLPQSSFTHFIHAGHRITPDFKKKEAAARQVIVWLHIKNGAWVRREF